MRYKLFKNHLFMNKGGELMTGTPRITLHRFLCFIVCFSVMAGISQAAGPLAVHPDNPRYFTDGSGKTIYLSGSHTWYNIHFNINNPAMGEAEFEAYLDWMQEYGHNFTRLWTGWANNFPKLWKRTGPGVAIDGELKFDLTQFDDNYFDLLRRRVIQVGNRGMYCSVMFFGSAIGFHRSLESWKKMAWHPDNNINDVKFSPTDGTTFFTATDGNTIELQAMLIRKFIDALNDQDHIIWEIANEAGPASREAQSLAADYARQYEAGKPKQHLIGITAGHNFGPAVFSSSGDWISPDLKSYQEGGPAEYAGKPLISDTDHLYGWGSVEPGEIPHIEKWVWKAFMRGTHPIFMDPYNSNETVNGYGYIDPMLNGIRQRLGDTLAYAEKVNLAAMEPSSASEDCSTTYCLINSSDEYLIYQPDSLSDFSVKLSAGTYSFEWFNVSAGNVERTGEFVSEGGKQFFITPFSGEAVLYLKRLQSRWNFDWRKWGVPIYSSEADGWLDYVPGFSPT
jgi:hypothetical protein